MPTAESSDTVIWVLSKPYDPNTLCHVLFIPVVYLEYVVFSYATARDPFKIVRLLDDRIGVRLIEHFHVGVLDLVGEDRESIHQVWLLLCLLSFHGNVEDLFADVVQGRDVKLCHIGNLKHCCGGNIDICSSGYVDLLHWLVNNERPFRVLCCFLQYKWVGRFKWHLLLWDLLEPGRLYFLSLDIDLYWLYLLYLSEGPGVRDLWPDFYWSLLWLSEDRLLLWLNHLIVEVVLKTADKGIGGDFLLLNLWHLVILLRRYQHIPIISVSLPALSVQIHLLAHFKPQIPEEPICWIFLFSPKSLLIWVSVEILLISPYLPCDWIPLCCALAR